MIKPRDCPICGGSIVFSYVRPDYDFYFDGEEIKRDTNKDLWDGKDPYLNFYCSNDRTHSIEWNEDQKKMVEYTQWTEDIEREFYEKIFPDL